MYLQNSKNLQKPIKMPPPPPPPLPPPPPPPTTTISHRPKIVVIGDAGTGKTSLIRALAKEPLNIEEPPTELRAVRDIMLNTSNGNTKSKVEVWDCGQISDEDDLHRLLEHVNVVLLTFDTETSLNNVENIWIDAVIRHVDLNTCTIMLVRCKNDLKGKMESKEEEIDMDHVENLARNTGMLVIECSAKDRSNMALVLSVLRLKLFDQHQQQQVQQQQQQFNPSSFIQQYNESDVDDEQFSIPSQVGGSIIYNNNNSTATTTNNNNNVIPKQDYEIAQQVLSQRANENDSPTKLRLHRSGSIDLMSLSTGVNVHVSSDGRFNVTHSSDESTNYNIIKPNRHYLLHDGIPTSTTTTTATTPQQDFSNVNNYSTLDSSLISVEQPLLVDVTLGSGVIGTLYFYREDDPYQSACEFLEKHGMDLSRAPELARIVSARVAEFIESEEKSFTVTSNNRNSTNRKLPESIIAKLKVPISGNKAVTLSIRHGDDVYDIIDRFQKTYGIRTGDPLLNELRIRIQDLVNKAQVWGGGGGSIRSLQQQQQPPQQPPPPQQQQQQDNIKSSWNFPSTSNSTQTTSLSDAQRQLLLRTLGIQNNNYDMGNTNSSSVASSTSSVAQTSFEQQPRPVPFNNGRNNQFVELYHPENDVEDLRNEFLNMRSTEQQPSTTSFREIGVDSSLLLHQSKQPQQQQPPIPIHQNFTPQHLPEENQQHHEENDDGTFKDAGVDITTTTTADDKTDDEYYEMDIPVSTSTIQPPPTKYLTPQQQQPTNQNSSNKSINSSTNNNNNPLSGSGMIRRPPTNITATTRPSPIRPLSSIPNINVPPPPPSRVAAANNSTTTTTSTSSSRRVPFFIVDVEIQPGISEKLPIYKDDNLSERAIEFVKQQGLPMTKAFKLQQLLEHQMKNHISRLKKGT
jgi:small GTP-binding protein